MGCNALFFSLYKTWLYLISVQHYKQVRERHANRLWFSVFTFMLMFYKGVAFPLQLVISNNENMSERFMIIFVVLEKKLNL